MNIYSYIRWSSDPQTWGDSERRQMKAAQDYCARKEVKLSDRTFKDRGQSARRGKHREGGALADLLHIVKAGDKILIEDNDRFSREDPLTALVALREVVQKGVTIVFLTDGTEVTKENFNNPAILFRNFFKGFIANAENERKAGNVSKAWKQKRLNTEKGIILTKALPDWVAIDTEKQKLIPKEPQASVVRRIFKSYANGKGIRTIMKELNAEKIPTFAKGEQNKGNGWSNTHLRRILCSRSVLGEYQPHRYVSKGVREPDGQPVPNYYPVIVDKATFYKVQDALSKHTHKSGCKRTATNLFTGTVKCARCGSPLVIKQSGVKAGKYSYVLLQCDKQRRGGDCVSNKIQYPWVERAVLTVLWTKVLPAFSERSENANKIAGLNGEWEHTKMTLNAYAEMARKGTALPQTLVPILNDLERKKIELERELDALTAQGTDYSLAGWKQVPKTVENRLRLQSILADEIESLVVDPQTLSGTLVMKEPCHEWTLQWARNDKTGFTLSETDMAPKRFPYVDEMLVWETPNSVPLKPIQDRLEAIAEREFAAA